MVIALSGLFCHVSLMLTYYLKYFRPMNCVAELRSCRQTLVNLPWDDPLRPKLRDLVTNSIDVSASDAAHASAYLQFDIHASFIMEYLLTHCEGFVPVGGIRCYCYSRFDDILGEAESVTLFDADADALVIGV